MARSVSAILEAAIYGSEMDEVFLALLTIDEPNLSAPIRVVNNTEDITSNGNLFVAYPFELELPSQDSESLPQMTLRIDNVDRSIITAVQEATQPPTVVMELVLASTPDVIEAGPFNMTLIEVQAGALIVEGLLSFEDVLNQKIPADDFNPADFPGLF